MARIHLIGVCGTAMATLAALLKHRGPRRARLRPERLSADERLPASSRASRRFQGYKPEHITADLDLVVVGNAISRGNPELEEVLDRKIRYCSLPEAVRDHFLWGARSIVIAGTHGKTTTTSLTGWLLTHGGADPSVFIGGIAENFESSYRVGGGREFVIEGDEYDSAFFDKTRQVPEVPARHRRRQQPRVRPRRHLSGPRRRSGWRSSASSTWSRAAACCCSAPTTPRRWRSARSAHCRVETFGLSDGADWQAHDLKVSGDLDDASACAAAASAIGALRGAAARRLQRPQRARGARGRRGGRAEHRHDARGAARVPRRAPPHGAARHRRAASRSTTISRIIRPRSPRRSTACARPSRGRRSGRSSSRARRPRAAGSSRRTSPARSAKADHVILPAVFRSTLPDDQRLSAEQLVADLKRGHGRALHPARRRHRPDRGARGRAGDLVVVMSNGGFDDIHQQAADRARGPPGR